MGTTSYLFRSIAFRTEAADSNDTSCSPLRPPKRIPTRNFLFTNLVWTGRRPVVNRRNGSRRVHKGNHKWFAGNLRMAGGGVVRDLAPRMAQSCHSPEFCQKVQCSALTLKVRCRTMGRKNQVFAQPFADIWQYSPFPPSAHVAEFLQQFTVSGYFDAERFWAFVSASRPAQQNPQAVGRRSSTSGHNGLRLQV